MQTLKLITGRLLGMLAFCASGGVFAGTAPPPPAPGTYFFNGNCLDCTPQQTPTPASAKLVVGANLATTTFEYDSLKLGHVVATQVLSVSASTGPDLNGPEDVTIIFLASFPALDLGTGNALSFASVAIPSEQRFVTNVSGSWNIGANLGLHQDFGNSGVWSMSPIPEPQAAALMLLGLAGLSGAVRRRKPVPKA